MAPSLLKAVGAVAVTFAAQTSAAKSYKVSEVYNSTNFFDKFDFFSDTDLNGGYVQYQSRADAESLGLVKYQDDQVYVGVDHTQGDYLPDGVGRKSVRLESKTVYNQGLVVADFSYLPEPVCGSWPAFWFFGEPWPTKGEIDIYENWNDHTFNRHTAHVDVPEVVGDCILTANDMTATIDSPNCYDFADGQSPSQGCSASEYSTTFGSTTGGVFAMEWTEEHLKIWDWLHDVAPVDVLSGNPSPSLLWGLPSYTIQSCNIDKAFKDMKMILNINFCSVAGQTEKWEESCASKTGYSTCTAYVAKEHDSFEQANFKVRDIKIYQLAEDQTSTSSAASSMFSTSSIVSTALMASITSSTALISSFSALISTQDVASSSASSVTKTSSASYNTASSTVSDDNGETTSLSVVSPTVSVSATTTDASKITPTSSAAELTTSTIYTTSVHTITSCPPTVTNSPVGSVTTEVSVATTPYPVNGNSSVSKLVSSSSASGTVGPTTILSYPIANTSVASTAKTESTTTLPIADTATTEAASPATSCTGAGCGVVEVGAGMKTHASLSLVGMVVFLLAL